MFDVESGLWTFSLNCPSKKTVDENLLSTKLKADIKKKNYDLVSQFYPKADDANFKLLVSHYVPQKTSNKTHFQNDFFFICWEPLRQMPVKVFLC